MSDLYDRDFYGWALEQAALLRAGKVSALDLEHVAEEIESVGRSERRELSSRLVVLLTHLLKWRFQPERRGRSWQFTIREQQTEAASVLSENPSLRPELDAIMSKAYGTAVLRAAQEARLSGNKFPKDCPWTYDQAMQEKP